MTNAPRLRGDGLNDREVLAAITSRESAVW